VLAMLTLDADPERTMTYLAEFVEGCNWAESRMDDGGTIF
jgi:hypothetical protein